MTNLDDFMPPITNTDPKIVRDKAPAGWQPGYTWDGTHGSLITSGLTERPKTWDEFIKDAGLNPEEVSVREPVQVRGWDAPQSGGGVVRMRYYKLTLTKLITGRENIDELIAIVNTHTPEQAIKQTGTEAYVFAAGDLQLYKGDGDGVTGTLNRYINAVDAGVEQLKDYLRRGLPINWVHIAWLGDCIEGFTSQGGANAWRTTGTLTEQIRLLRRMMLYTIEKFAPLVEKVTCVSIPGNHDEAVRFGNAVTRYDDSFAVDALLAVGEALNMNPAVFGHVQILTVSRDELTVTCEVAGTTITHAHGHKWGKGKHFDWWKGQTFGDRAPAAATMLLCGHMHHLVVDTSGKKTVIQVPALESESTWWRHKTGESGNPGVVTFRTRNDRWSDLAVL